MSLQHVLILVLAALLFAVTLLIFRRKGMSTKAWYIWLGFCIFYYGATPSNSC